MPGKLKSKSSDKAALKRKAKTTKSDSKKPKLSTLTEEGPQTPKKKGRVVFEKPVCTAVGLDILSQFYNTIDKTWSKISSSKLQSILNNHDLDDKLLPNIDDKRFFVSNEKYKNIVRHSLYGFGISLNPTAHAPIFSKEKETLDRVEKLLTNFVQNRDITIFMKALEQEGLTCNKNYQTTSFSEEQYRIYPQEIKNLAIHTSMLSALVPSYRDSIVKTEMELTRQYFAPLLGFTTLFDGVAGGSNCSIKDFINVASLGDNLKSKIPDFRPDDFTAVRYESGLNCIRIIREDSPDSYTSHIGHKDFISLIVQMKLALSYSMRQLIKENIERWHEQITVLGITASADCSYLYAMHCSPKYIDESLEIHDYTLTYIGEYKHSLLNDRISLVSKIITSLIFPKFTDVNDYLKTQTHQSTVHSVKKNRPNLFPARFHSNGSWNVLYSHTIKTSTKNIIKSCTVNGVQVVAKTSNGMEKIQKFLTLYISEESEYAFSFAGKCMADIFKENSFVDIKQIFLDLVIQLYLLQDNYITHNDIKPENIVLFDGHWFLIDYEIMKPFFIDGSQYLDMFNAPLKTKNYSTGYRAPERVKHDLISPKTDMYSSGLVLLELINRKRLLDLSQTDKLTQYIKESQPISKEEICIFEIVKKYMLAFDSNARSTAKDLIRSVSDVFAKEFETTLQYFSNKDLLMEKYL